MTVDPKEEEQRVAVWLRAILQREPRADAEAAMTELYRQFNTPVRGYLRRVWNIDAETLDEIVQDTFVDIWKHPERFRAQNNARFRTWLIAIGRHKALDALKKNRPDYEPIDDSIPDIAPLPIQQLQDREIVQAFISCADKLRESGILSELHYEVLHLTYVRDLTAAEIAAIVGCPAATVLTRLHYARKRLKHCLSNRLGRDPRDA